MDLDIIFFLYFPPAMQMSFPCPSIQRQQLSIALNETPLPFVWLQGLGTVAFLIYGHR